MRIAMLSPVVRPTLSACSERWGRAVDLLVQGLMARGVDVTVFETEELRTSEGPHSGGPDRRADEANLTTDMRKLICISDLFEAADDFDLIHNHLGALPLTYSRLVNRPILTTIPRMPSESCLPLYKKYDDRSYYVSLSQAQRSPDLTYVATVHPAIDASSMSFVSEPDRYLAVLGPILPENGTKEAIEIARLAALDLIIAGDAKDPAYFASQVEPHLDAHRIRWVPVADEKGREAILCKAAALLETVGTDEPCWWSSLAANACGTPVIAFPRGPLSEIITDGVNGFVVPDVSSAADAAKRIGTISRRSCRTLAMERFSPAAVAEQYISVYEHILERTKIEDRRPWGYYVVLSDLDDHKVKRIVVEPGRRLSLQRHFRRAEHWTVISGSPVVTRDDDEIRLSPGSSIDIPLGARHRVFNPGPDPVVFIEVQMGDYFGEDDIERFEDDFGRI